MAKPTTAIPNWASDATYTAGIETGLAPTLTMSESEISQGVRPGKFVARKFNWLLKQITDWLTHIEASRPDFVAGDSVYQAGNVTLNCAPGIGLTLTGGASTDFSVDRACTFTQTVGITGAAEFNGTVVCDDKVTINDELEINGLLNVDGDGSIAGAMEVLGAFEPKDNVAPNIQGLTISANEGYVLNGYETTVVLPGSTVGIGWVRLPVVTSESKKLKFVVINTLATGIGVCDGDGTNFTALPGYGYCVFHWTGAVWAWVAVTGTAAGAHTP